MLRNHFSATLSLKLSVNGTYGTEWRNFVSLLVPWDLCICPLDMWHVSLFFIINSPYLCSVVIYEVITLTSKRRTQITLQVINANAEGSHIVYDKCPNCKTPKIIVIFFVVIGRKFLENWKKNLSYGETLLNHVSNKLLGNQNESQSKQFFLHPGYLCSLSFDLLHKISKQLLFL